MSPLKTDMTTPQLQAAAPALLKALHDILEETKIDGTERNALCAIIQRICTIAINKATL